jgi:deaminated glutathione amidase
MRVTVVQMAPGDVLDVNLAEARRLLADAVAADRSDLVVLPETWTCLGGTRATKLAAAATLPAPGATATDDSLYAELQRLARELGCVLHCGSIGERAGERLYNTTLVFDGDGRELARYRKIHLFDVVTPSGTGYRESDLYGRGEEVVTFDVGDVRVGCAICYDLRFAGLFSQLRDRGAELVLLPAAFTAETGEAHWETLIRARAIETQTWFAAAATTGRHADAEGRPRFTFGHSMIVDPWGTVVATASRGVGWATATIDRTLTANTRRDMPVWAHRRLGA